jgi:hypothetical protein
MSRSNDVLIAFCDQDKRWLAQLTSRLDQQKSDGVINQWLDAEIKSGQDWLDANKKTITDSKVVVFLASPYFFNSDFSREEGLSDFLSRVKLYDLTVLWLAVGPCPVVNPLDTYPSLNTNPAMPLSAFPAEGSGLSQEILEVSDKIERAVTTWDSARRAIEDLLDGPSDEPPEEHPVQDPAEESHPGLHSAPVIPSGTVKIDTAKTEIGDDSFKMVFERQQRHFDKDCTLLLYIGTDAHLVRVSFQDKDDILLGRASDDTSPDIDLTPYFDREYGVSRNHARIHLANDQLFITDLNSVNKTHVNGQVLPPNVPRVLENGDLVRLGMMLVIVRFERPEGFS